MYLRFPMTANGKVDLRALPAADVATAFDDSGVVVGARTPTEMILGDIWSALLGVYTRAGLWHRFPHCRFRSIVTSPRALLMVLSEMLSGLPQDATSSTCLPTSSTWAAIPSRWPSSSPASGPSCRCDGALGARVARTQSADTKSTWRCRLDVRGELLKESNSSGVQSAVVGGGRVHFLNIGCPVYVHD
jgi:hypothetical protein